MYNAFYLIHFVGHKIEVQRQSTLKQHCQRTGVTECLNQSVLMMYSYCIKVPAQACPCGNHRNGPHTSPAAGPTSLAVISLNPLPHSHRALASPGIFPANDCTGSLLWDRTPPTDDLGLSALHQTAPNFLGIVQQSETFPTQSAFLPPLLS